MTIVLHPSCSAIPPTGRAILAILAILGILAATSASCTEPESHRGNQSSSYPSTVTVVGGATAVAVDAVAVGAVGAGAVGLGGVAATGVA